MTKSPSVQGARVSRVSRVILIGILSRVVTIVLGVLGKTEDYDQSGERIFPSLENYWVRTVVGPFSKWDAVYFMRIAAMQGYPHEQVHAFFPGFPLLMRLGRDWGLGVLLSIVGVDKEVDQLATVGWIISNVTFVLGVYLMYKIYEQVDEKLAFKAAVIYSFSACSVFMSAIYTESVFAALSFACILSLERNRFSLATVLAMAAAVVRANATFLLVYFAFIGLRTGRGFAALVAGLLVIVTVQTYLHWSKTLYCGEASWCAKQGIYGYVQNKYWDVGMFKYWQVKNVGFFLMALPTFLVAIRGAVTEFIAFYLMKLREKKNIYNVLNNILADKRSPYIAYLCVCLGVTAVIANVQIVTRLVSSSPAYFWAAANVFTKSNHWFDKLLMFVHVVYFFIGPFLFCNVLPWT